VAEVTAEPRRPRRDAPLSRRRELAIISVGYLAAAAAVASTVLAR
jgi:hypothetical protein